MASVKVHAPEQPSVRVQVLAPAAPSAPGKSAYELWLEAGNTGTVEEFLEAQRGADGTSFTVQGEVATIADLDELEDVAVGDAYKVTVDGHMYTWSGSEWVDLGPITSGKDLYQEWLDAGNSGTREEFLEDMRGADAVVLPAEIVGGIRVTELTDTTDVIGATRVTDL